MKRILLLSALLALAVPALATITTSPGNAVDASIHHGEFKPVFTRAYTGGAYNVNYGSLGAGSGPQGNTSTGTNTYRMLHYCSANVSRIKLFFGNFASATPATNWLFVKCAIEDSSGMKYPVYFNGSRTVAIPPGGSVYSDTMALMITNGDYIYSRTAAGVTNGIYSKGAAHQLTGEGQAAGDLVDSGTITTSLGYAYVPYAIYGETFANKDAIAIFGDSIAMGYDSASGGLGYYDWGIVSGLGDNFGQNWPHALMGINAETFGKFLIRTNSNLRLQLIAGCNVALCQLGINELGSLQTLTNNAVALWRYLNQMGLKVYQTTLTPDTDDSVDFWTTTDHQTVFASESVRTNFNNIIRSGGYGLLAGYCDAEAAAGTNVNGAIVWKPNYTEDGLHPMGTDANTAIWTCLTNMTKNLH